MAECLVMGNEAFAYAALEAGVRVVAGYPGTPSSEVIETIAREKARGGAKGVHVEWSVNEKVALELLASASYSGSRCLFTCKQVGLNVASDALMSLNYVGVKGGLVLFVADDPGPISSQTEQDTRRFAEFAKVPVLDPSTPEQGHAMIKKAFELSERYETPVIVRATTRICHASTFMEMPVHTQAREAEGFVKDSRWVIFPRRSYEAHGEINTRLQEIAYEFGKAPYREFNATFEVGQDDFEGGHDATYGIVASGISAAYAREALEILEKLTSLPPYRFLQIGTPYPFPTDVAKDFMQGLSQVIVFEELDSVLEDGLLRLAGRTHTQLEVRGKETGHTQTRGENSAFILAEQLAHFFNLDERTLSELDKLAKGVPGDSALTTPALPPRPPVLCAGCPHRRSFYTIKKALKAMRRPGIFSGDIGCYTLGNAQPLDMVDTCLCMGAGISMAQGFAVVEPEKKNVAFIGDSTFFSSGLSSIANAVYNQHDICIAVLDNSTTAMTGSQPHPGTGQTLMGGQSTPIDIAAVLHSLGVTCIKTIEPGALNDMVEQAREALSFSGPSAIIFKGPCIYLEAPSDVVAIDSAACIFCKRCITEIGCPALSVSEGMIAVDESLCTACGLCIDVCPCDAIKGGRSR